MKAFVLGALLLRTLNAQSVTDDFATDVTTTDDLTATAAPLIIPGPDAPSESELSAADAGASAGVDAGASADATPTFDDLTSAITAVAEGLDDLNSAITAAAESTESALPIGTADVIVDTFTPDSSSVESTPTFDAFGSTETADAGASFDAGFTFPTAGADVSGGVDAAAASPSDDFLGSETATSADAGITQDFLGSETATSVDPGVTQDFLEVPGEATPTAESADAAFATPDFDFGLDATATAGFDAAATDAAQPPQPGVTFDSNSTTATATDSPSGLAAPDVTPGAGFGGAGSGSSAQDAGGFGAAAVGDGPGAGSDANQYDGQDLPGDPDVEEDPDCPWWCYIDAEDNSYPDDDRPGPMPPPPKRALRARQEPASGGFATFNWPDGPEDDAEDDDTDVPDWASEASPSADSSAQSAESVSAQEAPSPDQCPAKCYTKPSGTAYPHWPTSRPPRPTETYTRRPWPTRRPWTRTRSWHPYPTETETGYPPHTTTLVTKTRTRKPYTPFSSVLASEVDWTGNTLAGVCPKTCNPFNPRLNKCDITTSCTTSGGSNYYCACRAGFMASAWNAKDFSKQFKVDGLPYVYVAPGVVCDKVCDDDTCTAVLTRPKCK